jgi:endonuclease-3 related protein
MGDAVNSFDKIYHRLLTYYGDQRWWPADDEFEVMVGAILTQNTNWSNVEKSIAQLKQKDLCNALALARSEPEELAPTIRSSGYYNQKAKRLIRFARWYLQQGGLVVLKQKNLKTLRHELLQINGVGDETADDMLLYAFDKPSFVIDSYTRRIFSRLGLLDESASYTELQQQFQNTLEQDVELFQQYHALIVIHAKQHCLKQPGCKACPLIQHCDHYGA